MKQIVSVGFAAFVLVACGDDAVGGPGGGPGDVTGPMSGLAVPDGSVAAVIWQVSSGSPDYLYKQGEGTVSGGRFSVQLPAELDEAAVSSYGVGVGHLLFFGAGADIPDGVLDPAFDPGVEIFGWGTDKAIIWRDAERPGLDWSSDFPEGYGCGSCVEEVMGFDSFAVESCIDLDLQVGPSGDTCNWT